jgi:hypothetical protein
VLEEVAQLQIETKSVLSSIDFSLLSGDDAADLVKTLASFGRLISAYKLKATAVVEKTRRHENDGHLKAGSWLSQMTGEPVGQSISELETAKAAAAHPVIEDAFTNGELSLPQVKEITSAADAFPEEAERLVQEAASLPFDELKKECKKVRFGASSPEDEVSRHQRAHAGRSLRTWTDRDGVGHLEALLTPDALAIVKQGIARFEKQAIFNRNKDLPREPQAAYRADAFLLMALSATPFSNRLPDKAVIRIRVDLSALLRGYALPGETCEIPGAGPFPVVMVRELLGDSILQLVLTDGINVTTIVKKSRHIHDAIRIALEERDATCIVDGCEAAENLERDHWRVDFIDGGETKLDNLCRLCAWHHYAKTHLHWRVAGGPGNWQYVPPDKAARSQSSAGRSNRSTNGRRQSGSPNNAGTARQVRLL